MNWLKNLLISALIICTSFTGYSQGNIKIKASTSVGGASLNRGSTFDYVIYGNGNGDNQTRQLLFDIQYDKDNFEIVSVAHTGTGGNGGILPQNSNPTISYYNYPSYTYNLVTSGSGANNTSNGTTNYNNASYAYNTTSPYAILRVTLTWSTVSAMPYSSYSDFIKVTYRLKAASTSFTFNPIKLNFAAAWDKNGTQVNTIMESPLSTAVNMNQSYGKYVTANVDLNSNLYNLSALKVFFYDTLAKTTQAFSVTSTGAVDVTQSLLSANTVYDVSLAYESLKTLAIFNSAITISDFTTAQSEFTSMGLDGSNGQNLKTGQSLLAADINDNSKIDGGDLPRLLAQVVGLDTLTGIPTGASSNSWTMLPTWKATDVITSVGEVEWSYVTPGATSSTLRIDMRKFPTGVSPNTIKSIQLFDVYTGPIEYVSQDASWAQYTVPSTLIKSKDGSSIFNSYIRDINAGGVDYAFKVEFIFDVNPNYSWGAITTSNWKTITNPHAYFKTGALGTNAILDLKYLLYGDVNRSHSSQVITSSGGVSNVQTNAINSLQTNTAFKSMSIQTQAIGGWINTPYDLASIDVNMNNITVTSNSIEVPVSIDTKGIGLSGLQFEFIYDDSKMKFDELATTLPNGWYVFSSSKNGRVKFGALDQNKVNQFTGSTIPFKLKFSSIGDGVDILTSIRISSLMDASDSKGNQVGINLNTSQIKLTGYNNF
jgi:hypothetical protein